MHPLEQTTIFGIKPFRAHRYVGKPVCVEEIEYINNTIQILSNFCHIDHRGQSRHPFRSSTQLPLQWPQSPLHSDDDLDSHFIEIMVKAILSEIPQHPLSHLTSLCSYPRPALPPHSQRRRQVHLLPTLTDFGSNTLLSPGESPPFPYACNSIFTSVISSGCNYVPSPPS